MDRQTVFSSIKEYSNRLHALTWEDFSVFSSAEVCDQFSLFALLGIALHYYCSESIKMPRTEVGLLGRSSILKLVKITIVRRSRGRGKGGWAFWTQDTRDTDWVLKWVLVCIAAFCCVRQYQIWIPEIEYYQKMASNAQIRPQGAEKQQSKVGS